jgi:hypothetical protein
LRATGTAVAVPARAAFARVALVLFDRVALRAVFAEARAEARRLAAVLAPFARVDALAGGVAVAVGI